MKLNVLDKGFVELINSMGDDNTIVSSARVSYLGESKGAEQDARLIKYLLENKHTSPFEQVEFQFRVRCPIFVARQWMRHRTWCLSGDTEITFNRRDKWNKGIHVRQSPYFSNGFTLEELYRKWNSSEYNKHRIRNMLVRVFDEEKREYTVSHIKNILYSGKKDIYEIKTKSGKKLKCSKDHLILTSEGWKTLEEAIDLKVTSKNIAHMQKFSCYILTNGEPIYRSYDWLKKRRDEGKSVQEIADEAECGYYTIRKWLKRNNLQFNPLDKNRNPPWNKGRKGYKINRVFSEEDRDKIRKARSGEKSNFWKGGISSERQKISRWTTSVAKKVHEKYDYTCQICGKRGRKLHAHHKLSVVKFPEKAYDFENLESICESCHRSIHLKTGELKMGKGTPLGAKYDLIVGVSYIGKEDTYDLEIEGDNNNFLANGVVVHNSFNEVSRRYTSEQIDFYIPEHFRKQSQDNKQVSLNENVEEEIILIDDLEKFNWLSLAMYEYFLEAGVSREQARIVLPLNMYTMFYAKVDLRNLLHFIELRNHPHAQYEIQVYAHALETMVKNIVPVTYAIWKGLKEDE